METIEANKLSYTQGKIPTVTGYVPIGYISVYSASPAAILCSVTANCSDYTFYITAFSQGNYTNRGFRVTWLYEKEK